MKKDDAIRFFGTQAELARAVGVSRSAVSQWPQELPPRVSDRVTAAMLRRVAKENGALDVVLGLAKSRPEGVR